jgi:RNA ligase (TIGR02306 family)
MRKLASIRKINLIEPIEGADAIEVATVDGWKVVVEKNEFSVDDLVVYFEIDSWVPTGLASFLSKGKEPREYNGIKGERLRTVKLRGQISQGLILPYAICGKICEEGEDVSELLGVQKYEPPIPAQLAGQVKSTFPSFIPKTDQERAQNIPDILFGKYADEEFEVSLKLDGSSCTVYYNNGEVGVCSRNLELKMSEDNKDNSFIRTATESGLIEKMIQLGRNLAFQGELMGPGIQGNREGLTHTNLYIFDIYDIDNGKYLLPEERQTLMLDICGWTGEGKSQLSVVPVYRVSFKPNEFKTMDALIRYADGPSLNHKVREGLVFKHMKSDFSFKVISNQFLLNEK